MIDARLLDFCQSDKQRTYLTAALNQSMRLAAKQCGVDESAIRRSCQRVKRYAEQHGYSPEHNMLQSCPDSYVVKGISTLYNEDGNVSQQWVKTRLSDEAVRLAMAETVEALKESIPRNKPVKCPISKPNDLLNVMVLTDYHIGSRSWPEETRQEPWDTDIAEDLLVRWFAEALRRAPDADIGVLAQLGDLIHYDGLSAITPTAGHQLDSDSRFQRMVRVVIRVIRQIIRMMLEKHQHVHVLMCEGNHDIASSAWLREVFAAFYGDEPRVTVDTSPDPYYCVEHGKTAVFFHHGHLRKMERIDKVFVAKFREVFGRTKHAFAHMGHYHHRRELESELLVCRQHRTLAAADAYASRGGYMSGREAQVITYHKEFGEVSTLTLSPEALP